MSDPAPTPNPPTLTLQQQLHQLEIDSKNSIYSVTNSILLCVLRECRTTGKCLETNKMYDKRHEVAAKLSNSIMQNIHESGAQRADE
jgi:hypothetical protein